MSTVYVVVTGLAAAANACAATFDVLRPNWLVANMTRLGVPQSQLGVLAVLKASGAVGLVVGIGVPVLGVAAAAGLILFFTGAILVTVRARWYEHLPQPAGFLLLAAGSLVLDLISA